MADNFLTTIGDGTGPNFAADDIASVYYPRGKVALGADGAAADWESGAGAVDTGTARVTLASDDPAVVDLAAIEVLITATNALLTTIDADTSNITACNTGAVVLAAGSAAVGKLAANSGVDIGDVDVTSIANGSLNGPGAPTIDSITQAAISSVTGDNQSLVAAPGANKQIWVYAINFSMSTAGTVAFQDEDDTAITGAMGIADTGGMTMGPSGNFAMPIWKVATNKALECDVVTGTINGSLTYAIVSV